MALRSRAQRTLVSDRNTSTLRVLMKCFPLMWKETVLGGWWGSRSAMTFKTQENSGPSMDKQKTHSLFPEDTHLPLGYPNGKQTGPTQLGFPHCTDCL